MKASAGGGGRGMRVVRTLADLPAEITTAEAEAASAFGDGTVFVEPYVEHGRHVEVQVLGHRDGVLVLGERDCSIQRRHQKVVEEAPAPNLPEKTRRALHDAAGAAAAAIGYRGAGTVEFLYDADADRFFFLEMNTRLQVEHPVTELVHGVDLVDLQLTVAEGRPLDQRVIGETYGHSIEVRLYAEDPAADWQPQSGLLTLVDVPGVSGEFDLLNRPGIRLDSGFETGSEVSTHYDAMLAKVIAWAPTREQAARRLADTLDKVRLHGVVTNRDLLVASLRHQAFLAGEVSTDFFDLFPDVLTGPKTDVEPAAFAAAVMLAEQDRQAGGCSTGRRSPGATWSPSRNGRSSRSRPARPAERATSSSSSGSAAATVTGTPVARTSRSSPSRRAPWSSTSTGCGSPRTCRSWSTMRRAGARRTSTGHCCTSG